MKRLILAAVLAGGLAGAAAAAGAPPSTSAMKDGMGQPAPFAEYVTPADSLPRLRYLADGLVTLNDRCPVRKVRLNPKMGASYVNGHPVGFC